MIHQLWYTQFYNEMKSSVCYGFSLHEAAEFYLLRNCLFSPLYLKGVERIKWMCRSLQDRELLCVLIREGRTHFPVVVPF